MYLQEEKEYLINADYLRGFWDGEGHLRYYPDKGGVQLVITNSNKELMDGIAEWMRLLGFRFSFSSHQEKRPNRKLLYRIDIQNYAMLEKWFQEIGSCRADRWELWEEIRAWKHRPKKITYPVYRKTVKPLHCQPPNKGLRRVGWQTVERKVIHYEKSTQ